MFNRTTNFIMGIVINCLASTQVASAQTTIRVVNLSTQPVAVEHGKIGALCQWQDRPCVPFTLKPAEHREFVVSSSQGKYSVSATALPRPPLKNPVLRSYFSSELGQYAFYMAAYGTTMYLTKETGEGLISRKMKSNKTFKTDLDAVARELADKKKSAARGKLTTLAANEDDPEFLKILEKIDNLIDAKFSHGELANLKENGSELLMTMATGEILRDSIPSYRAGWLEAVAKENPKIVGEVIAAVLVVAGANAKELLSTVIAGGKEIVAKGSGYMLVVSPKVAALALAHPYIAGKFALKGAAHVTYWGWNHFKTSTWTSIKATEVDEHKAVEIQIKDYYENNISMKAYNVSPESLRVPTAQEAQ